MSLDLVCRHSSAISADKTFCSAKQPPGFLFFQLLNGCQTSILAEIHCYLSTLKNWHNNSFLNGVISALRNGMLISTNKFRTSHIHCMFIGENDVRHKDRTNESMLQKVLVKIPINTLVKTIRVSLHKSLLYLCTVSSCKAGSEGKKTPNTTSNQVKNKAVGFWSFKS